MMSSFPFYENNGKIPCKNAQGEQIRKPKIPPKKPTITFAVPYLKIVGTFFKDFACQLAKKEEISFKRLSLPLSYETSGKIQISLDIS